MRLLIKFGCSEVVTIPEYRMSPKTYFTLISREACKLDDFILAAQQITYFLCMVWCWVLLYLSCKRVLMESVASTVFDRDLLLPFNPTYVLSNSNAP